MGKRKAPLGLRLDDQTEANFRRVAAENDRDLSAQFRVIFKEWLRMREGQLSGSHRDILTADLRNQLEGEKIRGVKKTGS